MSDGKLAEGVSEVKEKNTAANNEREDGAKCHRLAHETVALGWAQGFSVDGSVEKNEASVRNL